MEKKLPSKNLPWKILLAVYTGFMVWLLFFRNRAPQSGLPYRQLLISNLNLHPLRTVGGYLQVLRRGPTDRGFRDAFVNVGGNFFLFVLPGILLPQIWRRLRHYIPFICLCAGIIAAVEILQLFTLLGCCDIDDLILNLLGMSVGFLFFTLFSRYRNRHKERFL